MVKVIYMLNPKKRRRRRFRIFIFTVITFFAAALGVTEYRIGPVMTAIAESDAKNIATEAVNEAVRQVMNDNGIKYDDLISLTKNKDEKVTAIMVDSVKLNTVCAEIRGYITDYFKNLSEKTIAIPIGSLTGIDMLSGKGPSVHAGITLSGSAVTAIRNDFETAGINQTHHQMILDVNTKIYVIMQNRSFATEISNSIVIAETVVVGDVPEIYADGTNNMWQNLLDYE